ncbi:hypothetical protein JL720_11848 [Aureococcus anophagefferens]|nr:hypothetical protein JL720_11848 [Aureococcus anophagefferens]
MEGLRRSMSGVFTPRKKTPPPPTKGASPPPPPPPPDGDEQRPTFSEPPPPEAAKLLSSSDILTPAHSFLFKVERQASKKITGPITVRHGEIRPFQEGDFPTVYAMKRPADWPRPPEASGGDEKDAEPRRTPDGRRIWRSRGHILDIIPDPPDDDGPRVSCFPWTGANNYFMMCSESSIAMGGGGGSFGFFLDDDFSRGSSGPSAPRQPAARGVVRVRRRQLRWGFDPRRRRRRGQGGPMPRRPAEARRRPAEPIVA